MVVHLGPKQTICVTRDVTGRGRLIGEKQVHGRDVIGGDADSSWIKANEIEREQARAVVSRYAVDTSWSVEDLAGAYECAAWRIRQARWLALRAGLLEKRGHVFRAVAAERREG